MTRLWAAGERIRVDIGQDSQPVSFTWHGENHLVAEIVERWLVDTDWWEEQVWREYFKLIALPCLLVIVYRDLITESWWLQRLYD